MLQGFSVILLSKGGYFTEPSFRISLSHKLRLCLVLILATFQYTHHISNDLHFFQRLGGLTEEALQSHFDDFFEDIYVELVDKYGPIEELNICENLGDHLVGM